MNENLNYVGVKDTDNNKPNLSTQKDDGFQMLPANVVKAIQRYQGGV